MNVWHHFMRARWPLYSQQHLTRQVFSRDQGLSHLKHLQPIPAGTRWSISLRGQGEFSPILQRIVSSPFSSALSSLFFPFSPNLRFWLHLAGDNQWSPQAWPALTEHSGLHCVSPKIDMLQSSPLVPVNVTLFGERVFTEAINLK